MLSFIVPAYNEEHELPRSLASIRRAAESAQQPFEIIVVDDASTDGTAEIAKAVGAEVTLLHVLPELPAIYSGLPRLVESSAAILNSGSELGRNLRQEKEMLESFNVITDVVVRQGAVLEEILREIHVGKYDMVVTGSALSRSLRTYVLGDITREIVNRIGCAVLVVRSHRQPRRPIFSFKMLLGRRIIK
jgi:glycosyltransferase involved in cell wall biosynthesis